MADDQNGYYDDDPPDDDEGDEDGLDDCGMTGDGTCMLAGTEWCDWCCPLGAVHTLRRKRRAAPPPPSDAKEEGDG